MKRFWLSTCIALAAAACLAGPGEAQKGKGNGKGNGKGAGKGNSAFVPRGRSADVLPSRDGNRGGTNGPARNGEVLRNEPVRATPARSFAHPQSGNTLPQEVRDKLPPGLRDKPADHPGVVNHLRSLGLNGQPAVDPIPAEVRSQLPPGLRDRPYTHPGVANHLGKMGWRIGEDGALLPPADQTLLPRSDPLLPRTDPLPADVRRLLPPTLRDLPYDDPGVANQLGRMGWTIAEDGTLAPPPRYYPEVFPEFRPFGGFFRRW